MTDHMTTHEDMTDNDQRGGASTLTHEPPGADPAPDPYPTAVERRTHPLDQQRLAAPSRLTDSERRNGLRLGFEAFLIALCGYLIGVAGLPPLFDAPGGVQTVSIASNATGAEQPDVVSTPTETTVAAAPVVDPLPGAGVSVSVGRATWSTGYFQAALFKVLLEELGYEVGEPSANEQGPSEMYQTMASGSVDFWTNSWMPNHATFLDEETPDGTLVGSQLSQVGNLLPAGGLEGLVITRSVVDEFGIESLQQLNDDPELVELFDRDGNGKADISGCAADWGCRNIIDEILTFNGWDNLEQIAPEDYDVAVVELIERVDAGEPAMLYAWSPSGYLTRLRPGDNVLWLDMGGQDKLLDGSITPEYDFDELEPAPVGAACTGDPCYLGWAAADIMVTGRNDFLEANPSARVLFEQAQLKVLDVALANVKYDTGENTEADLERHAREWIAENQALVDGWLAAARAAG